MKTKRIKKLMISGISDITNSKNEMSDDTSKIPLLWDRYFDEDIFTKTFNKSKDGCIYTLYSDYESENKADFKVTIGVEVTKPKKAITIEEGKYLVFSKKGELPDIISEVWQEIIEYFSSSKAEYQRAFKFDFEKYVSEDEIEVYISIL